ncbi:MAG TPA: transferrin-binding protein-like solute binding protein [Sphingomicrobium sp.]|nr:transferrin-binding protein-like solute binding protein [Sphingomicrobium sp.]
MDILASPATQQFASLTSAGAGGDLLIRYDSTSGVYEIQVAGADWQSLRPSSTYHSVPEHYFSFGPTGDDQNFFQVIATADDPAPNDYKYSSLVVWGKGAGAYWDELNFTAFGVATSAASMPITGSATYNGQILGDTDIFEHDYLIGTDVAARIHGSLLMNFNFGAGTLSGSMNPILETFSGSTNLGTLSFVDTVYSTGSRAFSGRFDTTASGPNSFDGRFTGPAAEELIGRWAFPFIYSGDGAAHSAKGAWIAKQ